ncbi:MULTISPECIES: polysaccharide biosynthesis protein [unclassified Enterococcus]|uniref:putative polysaccharide biosynthesis protein n=1 Tax=unclassified Enterococcus TaxID=2608891 RepID=UPI00155701F2|nr:MULTISPECIES: polysaccharide biosynthesis protein [unclassified Enterococcus]MBS7575941.1 polysaccharide biosynthesis protein [Enterococcus sp. MMGLQ5-2]MBS7583174.1 polysaccharide biosynthesis protein [Enterococcus sp. MMGLQ5-1]NPD11034.1 polysaccharide biosynthesis protein [Enterococcus sp. MMGLQ5-1]NPD35777.1 polysaccharide biosynthesis protein [Enterococcus sp. MMGLQ5-2]
MEQLTEQQLNEERQQSQMVRGSLWLSAGNLISRLLGAIYIIPWYAWMGSHANEANSLFGMGYNVYALFLLISTAGIPAAIAKQTAKYNARGEYALSKRLFIQTIKAMSLFGLVAAVILYLLSPLIANLSGGGAALVPVIRSLSIAVLIFPTMSVMRGFFQGNNNMKPSAISQIVEQIVRVIWMLMTAFMIMKIGQGDYQKAVVQSTFAAFIGMLASMAVLLWFFKKENERYNQLIEVHGEDNRTLNTKDLYIDVIRQAIPFIIVGSGIQVFKLIDQITFINVMHLFSNYSKQQLLTLMSYLSANPDKLTMLIIAFAISIGGTGIPLITENYEKRNTRELARLINNNIQLFLLIMLPSVFGMIILAKPLYTLFYITPVPLAVNLLIWSTVQSLFLGFYMVIATMLQGIYQNRKAIQYFGIAVLIKVIIQIPLLYLFEIYGAVIATFIGFGVANYLLYKKVHQITHFNRQKLYKRSLFILILSLIMALIAWLTKALLSLFLSDESRIQAFIMIILVIIVAVAVYGLLVLITGIGEQLLGKKLVKYKNKLGLK